MICVIGATGTVGSPLVRELLARGQRVRGVTHSPDKLDELEAVGAEAVLADLNDPAELAAAFDGVERAFLAVHATKHQVELESNALAVAEQAGVYHVVKIGVVGQADQSPLRFARSHAETTGVLQASSLRWTVLQCAGFMQNYLLAPPGITARPDARGAHIDARDIAKVAARALSEEGHEACTYVLTGPEALTDRDVAATIGDVLGREVPVVPIPDEVLGKALRDGGMDPWEADGLLELTEQYRAGTYGQVTPDAEALLGHPPRTFRDFATDHRPVFAALAGAA